MEWTFGGCKYFLTGGGACPEQYDVFLNNKQVGYLRLRHGQFTVESPSVGGILVYLAKPKGDGLFDSDEYDFYIEKAIEAIHNHLAKGEQ